MKMKGRKSKGNFGSVSLYRCFGNKEIEICFNSLLRMGKIDLSIPFVWVRVSKELRLSRKGEEKASSPLQRTIA